MSGPHCVEVCSSGEPVERFEADAVLLSTGSSPRIPDWAEIDGDRVTLETSVGASFVVLRSYVIRRLDTDPFPAPTGSSEDAEDDVDGDDDGHAAGYAIGGAAIGGRARRNGATPRNADDSDDDEVDDTADYEDYEDEDEDDVETGGIDVDDEDDGEEADDPGQAGHMKG